MSMITKAIRNITGRADVYVVGFRKGSPKAFDMDDNEVTGLNWAEITAEADRLESAVEVRVKRNRLLKVADALVYRAEDTGADATAARQYRQDLRDVPQQAGFPTSVVWPTKPE